MKNLIIVFIVTSLSIFFKADKITEYKASNGLTYHLGDTVKLGRGSGASGEFLYLSPSLINTSATQTEWIKRKLTLSAVIIKKIQTKEFNGVKNYEFVVGAGAMYNLFLKIEPAIEVCEVRPCNLDKK